MDFAAELRTSIIEGDTAQAELLLTKLPKAPPTIEEISGILTLLDSALQLARIRRAHDAARLAALSRPPAYRPVRPVSRSTWSMDA